LNTVPSVDDAVSFIARESRPVLVNRVAGNRAAPGGKTPWCARTEIEALLEDSPSLRQRLDEVIEQELDRALRLAASALALYAKTARVPLEHMPLEAIRYNAEQVLGPWFPDGPASSERFKLAMGSNPVIGPLLRAPPMIYHWTPRRGAHGKDDASKHAG
jgi:hypothetical protein